MTCRQASGLGGQVRRGERSVTVVKVGTFRRSGGDGDGDRGDGSDAPGTRRHARAYRVFNADQIDGLPARFPRPSSAAARPRDRSRPPRSWTGSRRRGLRLETRDRGEAFYDMAGDVVVMPRAAAFESAHGATLAHEACHATGHPERLARDMSNARASYAREELVAELGACLVCAHLGVRPDHGQAAACVAGWLKALRCDRHEIFRAAAAAQGGLRPAAGGGAPGRLVRGRGRAGRRRRYGLRRRGNSGRRGRMTMAAFDTLKAVKRLKEAGLDEAMAEAMVETFGGPPHDGLATRDDLASTEEKLRADLAATEATLRTVD